MNRYRLLSEQQIKDITNQIAFDFATYPKESAEALMNIYLTGNIEDAYALIRDWVELAEDEIIRLNTEPIEEPLDDDFNPHYAF
jgi:hypothetical protein